MYSVFKLLHPCGHCLTPHQLTKGYRSRVRPRSWACLNSSKCAQQRMNNTHLFLSFIWFKWIFDELKIRPRTITIADFHPYVWHQLLFSSQLQKEKDLYVSKEVMNRARTRNREIGEMAYFNYCKALDFSHRKSGTSPQTPETWLSRLPTPFSFILLFCLFNKRNEEIRW